MASRWPRLTFGHKPVSIHRFDGYSRNGNGVEWDSVVCHKGTVRPAVLLLAAGLATAFAQTATEWRKVGGSAVDLGLAAPATGAVDQVWFSPGGSALLARTRSGKIYQTADFETWTLSASPSEPPALVGAAAARLPDAAARIIVAPGNRARL